MTDGAPALAPGVDPADAGLMQRPPRPRSDGVVTRRMWVGIVFVGAIMAAGTLLVLDASLPGGLIEGSGNMRYHEHTVHAVAVHVDDLERELTSLEDITCPGHAAECEHSKAAHRVSVLPVFLVYQSSGRGLLRLSVGRYMVIHERLRVCHSEQREGGAFGVQWSMAYDVPSLARTYVVGRRSVVVSIR